MKPKPYVINKMPPPVYKSDQPTEKPQFDKRWIKMAADERFKTKPASDKSWWELLPDHERVKAEAWIKSNRERFLA